MAQNNRKHEQAELIFKLGQLLGPLLKMAENPSAYDDDERTRILARLSAEYGVMSKAIKSFSVGEPGHDYSRQYSDAINLLFHLAMSPFGDLNQYRERANDDALKILNIILSIPIPIDSAIYEA
ncbi:MAG: hypothetical protein SVV80_09000 [Planctomycetota bacterium]|nr:hypothetical protein [Planctomycetota bacterium]